MLKERPGNVVVMSGRNRDKIERVEASVRAGLHVLADKPWILKSSEFGRLESTLAEADKAGVVAYDIMTERFEVTSMLQRALVNDRAVFGEPLKGTESDPAVYMESVHYLLKMVSGAPNIRPAWFFDNTQQGEGLNDVGTHLVDLVQWTLFPEQALDFRRDIQVLAAQRWATPIAEADFRRVTGEPRFPAALDPVVKNGTLEDFCNTLVSYTLRGIHTKLSAIWDWEPAPGSGDIHYAFYKGGRAKIEVRQTQVDKYRPELYVVPTNSAEREAVLNAVRTRVDRSSERVPWRHRGGTRDRDPCRDPRRAARRPRGTFRPGHEPVPPLRARPPRAAGVGASEHSGEVLRDDDGDRAESQAPATARPPARPTLTLRVAAPGISALTLLTSIERQLIPQQQSVVLTTLAPLCPPGT